jgi:hypothetical protein
MRFKYIIFLAFPLLLLVGSVTLLAQTDAGVCPALVEQALGDLGTNCDALDRNSACYGFNRVNATFVEAQAEDFFSNPADRTELVALDTIETAPLDTEAERWGIAVLNVQANVPNTLPGQAVIFLLMGEAQVENAVAPEDALELGTPIDVTTLVAANVRSFPSTNANVVGSVPEGTTLPADGVSGDEQWLRVLFENGGAWINRQVVDEVGDAATLPVITRESRTPMQAFNFRTGVGEPACVESPPSLLMIQGPDNVRVDITANGADIQIASTIVLWLLPNNTMQLVVINGAAEVGGVTVPEGFTLFTPLNEEGLVEGDGWTGFRALTPDELALLLPLQFIPENLLHYPIIIPTQTDIQQFLANLNASNTGGGAALSGPAAGQVDCGSLVPTSPLGGMAFGNNTFFWDGADGATGYQVNVYDENGALVSSGQVNAPTTSLSLNVTGGSGFSYSWEVSALVNGQLACTTIPVTMQRSAAPPPREPSCNFNYICEPQYGESPASCSYDC